MVLQIHHPLGRADHEEAQTDTTIEISIPGLPSHLRCHSTSLAGRTITTRIPLAKGSTTFKEIPFAHSVHYSARGTTCDSCFAQCNDAESSTHYFEHECGGGCGVHYCSESCCNQSLARHRRICHLIRQTNGKTNNARLMNESLALLISLSSNSQPLEEVMDMMADISKKGCRDTARAESKFRELVHCAEKEGMELEPPGTYAAALSVKILNAIGLYNGYGEEVAVAICPLLALVNHSCRPNCQQISNDGSCRLRALRDIAIGEELSYSYMSLEGSELERKDAIEDNWKFTCRCHRCKGGDCREFDAEHTCYCGAVCYEVDRTLGECVCNNGVANRE
mmetsp:Transcript_27016/g.57884  ORF Transcript_27016/g.57884 Transcript_27016/m.57884 type:complete len:337 (+) Transcript_27016:281-1291(+)